MLLPWPLLPEEAQDGQAWAKQAFGTFGSDSRNSQAVWTGYLRQVSSQLLGTFRSTGFPSRCVELGLCT